MKNRIKIAPNYTIDENNVIYNAKGEVVNPEADGTIKLVVNKVWMPYHMEDLVPMTEQESSDFEANIPTAPAKEKKEKVVKEKVVKEKVVKAKAEKVDKGPGVIASILNSIKSGPKTKDQVLADLVALFPDRESEAMAKTIGAQIGGSQRPLRIEKEKGITLTITLDADAKTKLYFYGE